VLADHIESRNVRVWNIGGVVMFGLGTTELILILIIVVVLFGAKRLPQVGAGLAKGIKSFRTNMSDDNKLSNENKLTDDDKKSDSVDGSADKK